MTDDIYDGDIYDGEPDTLDRHRDGAHDTPDEMQLRAFAVVQNDTQATLQWYTDNRSNPPFDPDGMCLKVCRTARNIGSLYPSAKEAQDATPAEHRVRRVEDLRRGMVIYFDTVGDSNPYGHVVTLRGRRKGYPLDDLDSLVVETNSVKANQLVCVPGGYFRDHWDDEYKFGATWLNGVVLDLPEPPKPEPDTLLVRASHLSMRTFLNDQLWADDCATFFKRAQARNVAWATGTEAARPSHREILKEVADDFGYRVGLGHHNDSWVAMRRNFFGPIDKFYFPVIDEPRNRGVLVLSAEHKQLGQISVAACHYLRFGRPDPATKAYQEYLRENKLLARKIGELGDRFGGGKKLFFYGGDQNIVDKTSDTFFGEDITSTWDELGRWQNTGHGNIDVIASLDSDRRVRATRTKAVTDAELHLHSDHFLVEAEFEVRKLR